jgi:alpha-1,6-mannosyltransferase
VCYAPDNQSNFSLRASLVNFAFYQPLDYGPSQTLAAAVVIRAELAALFALQLLLVGRISLTRLIKVGLFSLVSVGMSLFFPHASARAHTLAAVTVLIDSYFWDQWPLWPEIFSIYFNVYEGKSAEWGVSIIFI